jgi:hypothetical protein
VYDDNSATVVLVDKVVSDTVAVIVDTVVTWGSAIDVDEEDKSIYNKNENSKNHEDNVNIVHVERSENIMPVFNDDRYFDKGDAPNHSSSYSIVDCCTIQNIEKKCAEGKFSTDNSKKITLCDNSDLYVQLQYQK